MCSHHHGCPHSRLWLNMTATSNPGQTWPKLRGHSGLPLGKKSFLHSKVLPPSKPWIPVFDPPYAPGWPWSSASHSMTCGPILAKVGIQIDKDFLYMCARFQPARFSTAGAVGCRMCKIANLIPWLVAYSLMVSYICNVKF